jgi:hypothetical protein
MISPGARRHGLKHYQVTDLGYEAGLSFKYV